MRSIRRLGLGYGSVFVLAGAVSVLTGCGGHDTAGAKAGRVNDRAQAGAANDPGSSAGSGGSSGKSGAAGSTNAGSGGSQGKGDPGSAGTTGDAGSAGNAGAAGGPQLNDGEYSIDDFDQPAPTGDDHPLVAVENVILKRQEVSLVAPGGASGFGLMFDDADKLQVETGASAAAFLGGITLFDSVAANVDDDGNDELVAVGAAAGGLTLRMIDSSDGATFASMTEKVLDDTSYQHAWLRVADVDQDGRDEIAVVAVTKTGVAVRLFDDAETGFAPLGNAYAGPGEEIAAAFGNFDDDRAPELALFVDEGSTLSLKVLDDADHAYAPLQTLNDDATGIDWASELTVSGLRLEAGNFDDDARDELVPFVDGYEGNNGINVEPRIAFELLDNAGTTSVAFAPVAGTSREQPRVQPNADYRYGNAWGWQTMVADSNGDGRAEVFFLGRWVGDTGYDWRLHHLVFGKELESWTSGTESITLAHDVPGNAPAAMVAAAGRASARGATIVAAVRDGLRVSSFAVEPATGATSDLSLGQRSLGTKTLAAAGSDLYLTSGDWDGDSLRIRYTGQKWLELTRPRPLVVLAAPPAKDGIAQAYDNTQTTYGTELGHDEAEGEEYAVTNKVTLSFEASVPGLDFLTAGASASMAQEFATTHTQTTHESYGRSYTGAYPDDVVVFNGILCERYQYEVMGGGDPGLVGTLMTIDVPIADGTYKWTVDYYNSALDGLASPIDETVLTHTVGDPSSYPSKAEVGGFQPTWRTPEEQMQTTGQGHSYNSATIDVSEETTDASARTLTTELGGSVGCFVKAEYSQAWDETATYSVTVGEYTHFQGDVGDIERSDYATWHYQYGMFVYPATLSGGEKVQVVQYYTDGLGDGYSR